MATDRSGDFGTKLREARERKGVSLRQIANKTKISVAALEALERNDITRLPGGIFSRAFVRSYAIEVGLDPEKTIANFVAAFPHELIAAAQTAASRVDDNEAIESDRRTATTFLRLIAVSIPVAIVVLYFATMGRRAPAPAAAPPAGRTAPASPAPAVAQTARDSAAPA